jgi:NAD(P)-dependent dehydrogenase (short-subunit alcohol dehydrogenase family)
MHVAVYGASGHTGRFVIAELLRRGHAAIAIGRDASKLERLGDSGAEIRLASLDAPESLVQALSGADAVIHCAGPFLDTAAPLIEAALRARVHYFDLTAEQQSAISTFEAFDARARERGIVVACAAGFYGGLGDLLATSAMRDWEEADGIDIAIALDRWWPTRGTRLTGQRNHGPRFVLSAGTLEPLQPSSAAAWRFPEPFGSQDVVELPFTETILIARHLRVRDIRNYVNQTPLRDLRDPETPAPVASDDRGRSSQHFFVDVIVRRGNQERHATASGRDIYAVTAPIVAEAAARVVERPPSPGGAYALGELVDARDFLEALAREGELDLTAGVA